MSVYDLTGRKALVTGGARGLGEGMARALARAGAAVVIADIREDLGKATAGSLREDGANAEFVALDVTSDESWAQAVPQAIAHLGGPRHPGQQRGDRGHVPADRPRSRGRPPHA